MPKNCRYIALFLLIIIFLNLFLTIVAENVVVRPTRVQLSLAQTIDAETANQGDPVEFVVVHPVYQDGKIIVPAGARAYGRIEQVTQNGLLGKPASLAISLTTVDAIDGSKLPIIASKTLKGESRTAISIGVSLFLCILGVFIKGENVTMQAGYIIDADILGGNVVNVP